MLVSLAWTLGSPWQSATECEITHVITTRRITLILECAYKSICNIVCAIRTLGRIVIHNKTYHFCYQKDHTSSRSVSIHQYLSYNASCAHRRGRGGKKKFTFFAVTTRPISHSGRCVCIRNCVGEFGMDTGQPLVISNRM